MAYTDAQFNAPRQIPVAGEPASPVSLGTATASGTNTFAPAAGTALQGSMVLPKFQQPTVISGIKVYCTTAPAANLTAVTFIFLNGTNTFAVATDVGAAANASVDASLASATGAANGYAVASNGSTTGPAMFGSGGQPALKVLTTSTASALTQGSYAIDFVYSGLFTT